MDNRSFCFVHRRQRFTLEHERTPAAIATLFASFKPFLIHSVASQDRAHKFRGFAVGRTGPRNVAAHKSSCTNSAWIFAVGFCNEILQRMSVIRATVATLLHDSHLSMERQWGPVSEVRSKFWCRVRWTGLVLKPRDGTHRPDKKIHRCEHEKKIHKLSHHEQQDLIATPWQIWEKEETNEYIEPEYYEVEEDTEERDEEQV